MLDRNLIKLIHSLEYKKYRKRANLFVAEGPKTVGDMMRRIKPYKILATSEWTLPNLIDSDVISITDDELAKISFLQHPQFVLALFHIPETSDDVIDPNNKLILVMDGIQDPGNFGTIIRIADWFGIDTIVCSKDTVDAYNPKTVQATMGSLARVNIIYKDIDALLDKFSGKVPIYGTLLDGENIYTTPLKPYGFVIMGNEGNGISQEIKNKITTKLLIPNFGDKDTAESLNVAIATAITCSEFMRRKQ